MDSTINVRINGRARSLAPGMTLVDLLGQLDLDARVVVVEHNRSIVRGPALGATVLTDGDAVELVHFVGGG